MITHRRLQCPFCRTTFQAWYQLEVKSVVCPFCMAEVDVKWEIAPALPPPRRGRLIHILAAIWRPSFPQRLQTALSQFRMILNPKRIRYGIPRVAKTARSVPRCSSQSG